MGDILSKNTTKRAERVCVCVCVCGEREGRRRTWEGCVEWRHGESSVCVCVCVCV